MKSENKEGKSDIDENDCNDQSDTERAPDKEKIRYSLNCDISGKLISQN